MSFHKKVLIGYVLFNGIFFVLSGINYRQIDHATLTDQDLVVHGVARPLGAALLLLFSSIAVGFVYAGRCLARFVGRIIRKSHWKS